MSRAVFQRLVTAWKASGVALAVLALSACAGGLFGGHSSSSDAVGPSGPAATAPVDLATQQACRRRVNEMYDLRERGDIYAANSSVNTPYSANYQAGVPSRGLSNQFAYERTLAECEHNAQTGAAPIRTTPPPPPAAKGQ